MFRLKLFLAAAIFMTTTFVAYASEFSLTDADTENLMPINKNDPAKRTLNAEYFDQKLGALLSKAQNYPPKFSDAAEYNDAQRLTALLIEIVKMSTPQFESQSPIRAAHLYTVAYNLDLPEATDKEPIAIRFYKLALEQEPDSPLIHLDYGAFLMSANSPKPYQEEALRHIKRAIELGATEGRYTLGLAYFMLGNKKQAIKELQAYAKEFPNDTRTSELITKINDAKIKTTVQ